MYGKPEEMAGRAQFGSIHFPVHSSRNRGIERNSKLLTEPVKTVKEIVGPLWAYNYSPNMYEKTQN